MTAGPTLPQPQDGAAAVVAQLRAQIATTPRAQRPAAHAALRYRLGMALAELPSGDRSHNLRQALSQYDRAVQLYRPGPNAQEHARVQTARAAALRELGDTTAAIAAAEQALRTVAHLPGAAADRGAALNNLALACSDAGSNEKAVEAAAAAVAALGEAVAASGSGGGTDGHPQLVMAQHNHGQVLAAASRHDEAIAIYRAAVSAVDAETLPFHWALLHHALGISHTALDAPTDAIVAFQAALRVFTRARHPLHHALASHNVALAWAAAGDVHSLRRAAVSLSDALSVLDPRVQRELWQQAYDAARSVEARLAQAGVPGDHVRHLVALLAEVDDPERTDLARTRLMRVLTLPQPHRRDALTAIMATTLTLEDADGIRVLTTLLTVLLELPDPRLREGLEAATMVLGGDGAGGARLVERAISEGMLAPQRLRVRDHLGELGYERP